MLSASAVKAAKCARNKLVSVAEYVGQLSMQVPLFSGIEGQQAAPLAEVAEWLSQNLQNDVQGDNMASSPTHASRWGPLAPAGIVESTPALAVPALLVICTWKRL